MLPVVATLAISTGALSNPLITYNQQMPQVNPLAPGIIIKYKDSNRSESFQQANLRAEQIGKQFGYELKFKRNMSGEAEVLRIVSSGGNSISAQQVPLEEMVAQLNNRPDVEFAEIDALMIPYATPNDTAYNTQWHYFENAGGMRLPAAWDVTTGNNVTVAVLDTGYRPHADLAGNVVGQYDMISSSSVANDGGGRDSNAQDPGDWTTAGQCGTGSQASNSSWHGTHVAGTVGAVSNNNSYVAGVAWNVDLVPVRVLGTCGGSLSDIADGIRWAAGLSVSGVPSNPNPADVINMSLGSGSPASCSSTYQSAITAAVNAGTTVVVAAGNSNSSSGYPPANCSGVVSVAATNRNGGRAYYSNYGSAIDVAAPGGDGCNPIGEGQPTSLSDCEGGVWSNANMIQSTYNSGTTTPGSDNIGAQQGTSMAAPHVAGLAALMYAVKPSTTPAEVESVLKSTARSFPNVSSHQCTTSNCGAGIVDSDAAVAAMSGTPPPPPPPTNNVLTNGVPATGLSGATGSETNFTMAVPSGATGLSFDMSGGTGDADLYVKFGSAPTTSSYDCRPYAGGNNESCPISNAQSGTYHVMIRAYSTYSGVSLEGSYSTTVPNVAPNASFTSSCNDLTCSFNASGSSDSDGSIASYSWSFGGSGVTASNTFASAGTYSVTLTVTDNDGATDTSTSSVTVTAPPPPPGGNVLQNGVAATGLSASTGNDILYTMDVPAGATDISFSMSGGSGDADLYVRFGAAPTDSTYDCRPYAGGNNESCTGSASGGTYYVRVKAYSAFSGVSLTGSYTEAGSGPTPIDSTTNNISVGSNAWKRYTVDLGSGYSNLTVSISGGSGDADLYVRRGAQSTTSAYDCRPYKNGNNEECTFNSPASGTWHIDLRGYSAASGVTLRVQAD